MNYWVLKGNPARNPWDDMLHPGAKDRWHTGQPPKSWMAGDRLFCWESSPKRRIIALAELGQTDCGPDEEGHRRFEVRYLTPRLSSMPVIDELRQIPVLNQASFLKSGPAITVFPLKLEQADILFRLLCTRNPELQNIWPDIEIRAYAELVPDVDDTFFGREGRLKLAWHFLRERDRGIVEAKRQAVLGRTGGLECEVCGFSFEREYGVRGRGFCEVHHRLPLSETDREIETRLDDLAIVCSNCHRMIHRGDTWLEINELKRLVRELT